LLTADYIELEQEYGAHNYHPLDVVIERAQGIWVYDTEGKRYMDCLSAYSALNQGHCHPAILDAMIEQARTLTLTSRAFRNVQLPLFYEDLHRITGFEMALPMNSGAEAVETALKAARIISMAAPSPSLPSPPTTSTSAISARFPPVSAPFHSAMRTPCAPPSHPTPAPFWSSRCRAKPAF